MYTLNDLGVERSERSPLGRGLLARIEEGHPVRCQCHDWHLKRAAALDRYVAIPGRPGSLHYGLLPRRRRASEAKHKRADNANREHPTPQPQI